MDDFIPTNTLANADFFDIMKMDAVDDPLITLDNYTSVDFDESYFADAVHFVNESNNEITNKKIKFYKALSEASNEVAVLESFSDYFSGVKDIINKVIKFLKTLVDKFIIALNKFIDSDSYLKKHIKNLNNFKDETGRFTFTGYNFTFDDNIPSTVALATFDANLFSDIKPTNGILDIKSITDAICVRNLNDICDNFRAEVIGKSEPIYATEYQNELFKVYRDDKGSSVEIEATKSYITEISTRYTTHSKMESRIKSQQNDIIKTYDTIQKQVADVVRSNGNFNTQAFLNNLPSGTGIDKIDSTYVNYDGATMSGDLMAQLDVYIRGKVEEIKARSDIHTLAFSAKLDAIKEAYKQDRNVLYTALSKTNSFKNLKESSSCCGKGCGDECGTNNECGDSSNYNSEDENTEFIKNALYGVENEENTAAGTDDYGEPMDNFVSGSDVGYSSSTEDDEDDLTEAAGPIRKINYKIGDWLDERTKKRTDKLTNNLKKEGVKIPSGMTPYKRVEHNKLILVDKQDKVHIMTITTGDVRSVGMTIYEYKQSGGSDQDIIKTASSVATTVI